MLKLFGLSKIKCVRCDHANLANTDFCAQCGLQLGSPTHQAIMRQQHWLPADDEIALFFGLRSVSKLTQSALEIPARARAFVLQNGRSLELFAGDYDVAGLQRKTHALDQEKPIQILITRSLPFALHFSVEGLHTAEFLPVKAACLMRIKIEQTEQFARHFMGVAGRLTTRQLEELLLPMLQQSMQAWLSTQSLRAIEDQSGLRQQLNEHLLAAMNQQLATYGFAATEIAAQELRHEKLSAEREKLSEQTILKGLQLDAQQQQVEQGKLADASYSEREWQRIAKQEEQVRLRYRHEEMRQQFGKDLGWLYLQGEHDKAKKRLSRAKLQQDESERLQTIRLRELALYAQVAEAATRQQALDRGAAETIRALEHHLKNQSEQRQNEADQWLHVRTLARIKMRSESELTQLHSAQAAQLLQQEIAQQIQKNQLQHEIAQSYLIADQHEQQQTAQYAAQAQREQKLRQQQAEQALEDERQKNRLIVISLETEVRAREFQRMQDWEQELHQQRQRDLQREARVKDVDTDLKVAQTRDQLVSLQRQEEHARALAQQEKLLRTIEAHGRFEQQAQDRQLQAIQRERDHQLFLAKAEIERMSAIANFSETGKIATADIGNAAALADIMKLQTQANMSAEQILATQAGQSAHAAQAMSAMAQIQQGMSLEQAMKMLQERLNDEREQRETDLQRRHQIDLTMAQGFGQSRSAWQFGGQK
ncbi:SPFH domain-containing protein [Undibacterium sp. Ji22W]|uniref:SPFH domain-containing protein n=1 Tax=Undibacterium sp. Ji22W TaxID=3413038 RepID=UPI003BF3117C